MEKTTQSGIKPKNLLLALKYIYRMYKSDLAYVKHISRVWKQKPYRFGITELSILWHYIYWVQIK